MDRTQAERLARMMRLAETQGRWEPTDATGDALILLEQSLSIRIQAGQPELDAMQARLIGRYATDLTVDARADYAAGRIEHPTMLETMTLATVVGEIVAVDFRPRTTQPRIAA